MFSYLEYGAFLIFAASFSATKLKKSWRRPTRDDSRKLREAFQKKDHRHTRGSSGSQSGFGMAVTNAVANKCNSSTLIAVMYIFQLSQAVVSGVTDVFAF